MKVVVDYTRSMGPLDDEVEKSMNGTVSMLKGLGCQVTVKGLGFKYECSVSNESGQIRGMK